MIFLPVIKYSALHGTHELLLILWGNLTCILTDPRVAFLRVFFSIAIDKLMWQIKWLSILWIYQYLQLTIPTPVNAVYKYTWHVIFFFFNTNIGFCYYYYTIFHRSLSVTNTYHKDFIYNIVHYARPLQYDKFVCVNTGMYMDVLNNRGQNIQYFVLFISNNKTTTNHT